VIKKERRVTAAEMTGTWRDGGNKVKIRALEHGNLKVDR
jgi:hypothetical protein